ncbi:aminopeptidase O isoform X1 [Paramormyrops kingsleyae]|uniref:aminopeptidase O isoform X1 n=2 Tax=Paramormyrops kingsleyae TaxID=1676925 RepID=UPI003B97A02E
MQCSGSNMESGHEMSLHLDPNRDDLPLKANTSQMLVRHYVLDLKVHLEKKVIIGSVVLFLEVAKGAEEIQKFSGVAGHQEAPESLDTALLGDNGQHASHTGCCHSDDSEEAPGEGKSNGDFTLVLDCCDLAVMKVEEVDVASVPGMQVLQETGGKGLCPAYPSIPLLHKLVHLPSTCWEQQHDLYRQCSQAPAPGRAEEFLFSTDRWSLQIWKRGVPTPHCFPRCIRICYETKCEGTSVRWTKDQSGKSCVYTMGSPINNRALFPCQEPPVAMSTWQARVHAPSECTALLSGENEALPVPEENGFSHWDYYVTMPMPASTFTIAVGHWVEARVRPAPGEPTDLFSETKPHSGEGSTWDCSAQPSRVYRNQNSCEENLAGRSVGANLNCRMENSGLGNVASEQPSAAEDSFLAGVLCSHVDYPCRFTSAAALLQEIIPYRVFAPSQLLRQAAAVLPPLLAPCLAAARAVLGVHPFARLDLLVVPAEFPSLGMASPHMVFLSQSLLGGDPQLCGARLCHEIAHAWFGLAIGAQDWTEEWISEGFATYLEDVFWARVQKLSRCQAEEQYQLKALLCWRRLRDELQNSDEELQILRPNKENTGQVSESGASVVKHALNPDKAFMQVHYLKGYFLLSFFSSIIGEEAFLNFFRHFVRQYHGRLILSQDFLQMLLDHFPEIERQGLTLEVIYADWLDNPAIPEPLLHRSAAWLRTAVVGEVRQEVAKWIHFSRGHRKGSKRKRVEPKVNFKGVIPEQLVLLLELLLDEPDLSLTALRALEKTYHLQDRDAEVRHRWCELVVKHKHTAAYKDVERFLLQDQAMGVYLYGELMVQEDAHQQALARRCFSQAQEEMDPAVRKVVEEMIY